MFEKNIKTFSKARETIEKMVTYKIHNTIYGI